MTTTLCCATSTLCQRKYSARQIRNFHYRTGNLSLLRGNDYSLRDVNLTTHLQSLRHDLSVLLHQSGGLV